MKEIKHKETKIFWPKYKNSYVENCSSESEGELEILFYCFFLGFKIVND